MCTLPPRFFLHSDPVIVLVLSVAFVFSVMLLHILGRIVRYFYK